MNGDTDQAAAVRRLVERVGALEAALAEAHAARRAAHNALVELRGNIRVFCRLRPGADSVLAPGADGTSLTLRGAGAGGKDTSFSFDKVFGPTASQAAVFTEVSELVQSAVDGYAVCVFSYGQTGAGKTHTMTGASADADGAGIIPRSIAKILEAARRARVAGWEFELEASFVEVSESWGEGREGGGAFSLSSLTPPPTPPQVYNESLRDLLAPDAPSGGGAITDVNAIQHDADGHTTVTGAARVPVDSEAAASALVAAASAARSTAATAMNDSSSRSHSVFMLRVSGRNEAAGVALKGALNLVDLAGSERLSRSLATGARAKEAASINKSLSALGDVFASLAAKVSHVPYRNSKLTRLLEPCLGGTGKTLMFVNVAPDAASAGETLCSLRFAERVNAVETAAKGGAKRAVAAIEGGSGAAAAKKKAAVAAQAARRR